MATDERHITLAYAREKFGQALHAMSVVPGGRPQDLLRAAYMCFHPVQADDFPAGELRNLFVEIKDDLTFEDPVGNEGRVEATLGRMSDDDACELIERLMTFYRKLRDAVGSD